MKEPRKSLLGRAYVSVRGTLWLLCRTKLQHGNCSVSSGGRRRGGSVELEAHIRDWQFFHFDFLSEIVNYYLPRFSCILITFTFLFYIHVCMTHRSEGVEGRGQLAEASPLLRCVTRVLNSMDRVGSEHLCLLRPSCGPCVLIIIF